MMQFFVQLVLVLLLFFCVIGARAASETSEKSPLHQHLPDCGKSPPAVPKKRHTAVKGIACPMVKDEQGFLSEWVAFYELQGFSHIIFYDNNSTTSFEELDPWIKDGFVTIRRDWFSTQETNKIRNTYFRMMAIKMAAEVECKERAVEMGYEIFVSVDLDEYVMPSRSDTLLIDELADWFNATTRGIASLSKLQFPATPHMLEPVNLLTIEAYQTRMRAPNKMNYYTSVSSKVALRLTGAPEYTNDTSTFLVHCCDFHGCGRKLKRCHQMYQAGEKWKFDGKHRPWRPTPPIFHYARTLEKYISKQKSWSTASSNTASGYSIYNYLDRASGHQFDNSAIVWGCGVRELLRKRTNETHYLRPGDFWYRNPEFGKLVSNENKRGRHGSGLGKRLGWEDMSPYPVGDTYQAAHKVYAGPDR